MIYAHEKLGHKVYTMAIWKTEAINVHEKFVVPHIKDKRWVIHNVILGVTLCLQRWTGNEPVLPKFSFSQCKKQSVSSTDIQCMRNFFSKPSVSSSQNLRLSPLSSSSFTNTPPRKSSSLCLSPCRSPTPPKTPVWQNPLKSTSPSRHVSLLLLHKKLQITQKLRKYR